MLSKVEVPQPSAFVAPEPAPESSGFFGAFGTSEPQPQEHFATPEPEPRFEEPKPAVEEPPAYEEVPAWAADPAPAPVASNNADDDESDPFLAELRRAVRDDGPLGPRDDEPGEDDSIDRLYADDDDDKSFFKRKK